MSRYENYIKEKAIQVFNKSFIYDPNFEMYKHKSGWLHIHTDNPITVIKWLESQIKQKHKRCAR